MTVYKVVTLFKGKLTSCIANLPLSRVYELDLRVRGYGDTPLFAFSTVKAAKRFCSVTHGQQIWEAEGGMCRTRERVLSIQKLAMSDPLDVVELWVDPPKRGFPTGWCQPLTGTVLCDWIKLVRRVG